jgi:hypothetical protein
MSQNSFRDFTVSSAFMVNSRLGELVSLECPTRPGCLLSCEKHHTKRQTSVYSYINIPDGVIPGHQKHWSQDSDLQATSVLQQAYKVLSDTE